MYTQLFTLKPSWQPSHSRRLHLPGVVFLSRTQSQSQGDLTLLNLSTNDDQLPL